MSQPYVGEIRMFGGNFAPMGWALCDGQLLSIAEYSTLFNLIGTTYGGDGQITFALPDLQGRIPIHQDASHVLGQFDGVEAVTLSSSQIPVHSHGLFASSNAANSAHTPADMPGASNDVKYYGAATSQGGIMAPSAIGSSEGGGQPHNNMAPYLCVNFIISLFGIFPSPA